MSSSTAIPSVTEQHAIKAAKRPFISSRDLLTLGVLAGLIAIFSILQPNFLSQANWLNTTATATQLILLAVGQTFVIITGGIDLSVGAVVSASGVASAWVMANIFAPYIENGTTGIASIVGILVAIVVGGLFGLANGLMVVRLNIPPFVATLGSMGVATGTALLITNGMSIADVPEAISGFGRYNLFGWLPLPVLVTILIVAFCGVLLSRSRFGAHTYAIGDSFEAAARAGIRTRSHLIRVYVLTGVLAGIAGLLIMSRLTVASPSAGSSYELNAIACVVIGGASLFGGRGTLTGSILGALIITCLISGLVVIGVPPFWQIIGVGVVLVAAVALDQRHQILKPRR